MIIVLMPFRKDRSCLDQAFVLSLVVKNQLNANQSKFFAFVDMEMALDWANRDLYFYKLLPYNADGLLKMCTVALNDVLN